jgi:hypothetical protein
MVPFTRTLVDHLISKRDHSRITGDIDLMIMVTEFMNSRVLAEIPEPGKEFFPSLYPTGEIRKSHDNLRVHYRCKAFDLAIEPDPVDSTHCRTRSFVFGFLCHFSGSFSPCQDSYQLPAS